MNAKEIRNNILNDRDFISAEIQKLLTYYKLKHTLRWGHDSTKIDEKESVAEHVFGLTILSEYFLPLQENKLDEKKVQNIILWHDMAEALVDDMTTITKTDLHKQSERDAELLLLKEAPAHLHETLKAAFSSYEEQACDEAKFVKALDKLESLFQIRFLSMHLSYRTNEYKSQTTAEIMDKYQQIRLKYVSDFPDILKFSLVLTDEIKQTDFVHPEVK